MWGNFRTGPEVRHEFVLRPEPDVDSRRRRKPRSGRGLLPRTAARCSLGRRKQQVGPHAETGAQPLHHRHGFEQGPGARCDTAVSEVLHGNERLSNP